MGKRRHGLLRKHGPVIAVLLAGVAATWWAAFAARAEVMEAAGDRADRWAVIVSEAVRVSVENLMTGTAAAAGLFVASDEVRASEFEQFVTTAGQHSGSIATVYIPIVTDDDWPSFVASAGEDFTLFRFNRLGGTDSTAESSTRWPVLYSVGEPSTFPDLAGFDAASDPVWAELLTRTERARRTSISGPTQLFGIPGDWGFVAASPIVDGRTVVGYTATVASLSGLVEAEFEESLAEVIRWQVRDLPDDASRFASVDALRRIVSLSLGGRTWEVDVTPTDEGRDQLLGNRATVRTGLGVALTLAAAIATHLALVRSRTRREAEHLRLVAEEKDELLTALSHELRTPLTVVVGMADILEQTTLSADPEIREYVRLVKEEGDALARLVDDLLLLGRLEAEVLPMRLEVVDVAWEVERIISEFPISAENLNVEGSSSALADPLRLRHIIRHLYSNAVRWGGTNVTIRITESDHETIVLVCDDGPGVPDDKLQALFSSKRGTKETPGGHGSLGLGLRVSMRLAGALGGDLSYRRQDSLTIFELRLPTAQPTENMARHQPGPRQQAANVPTP